MDNYNDIALKKLLLNYHDAFYKLFHLPLDFMAPDNRAFTICGKSHCNALCVRIMESEKGAACCSKILKQRVSEAKRTGKVVVNRCHAGFYDALIPIVLNGDYMGSLCVGQFLRAKPDRAELEKICSELDFLNLSIDELESYCAKTRILSDEESEGLIELVQMLGEYICESYSKLRSFEFMRSGDPVHAAVQYIKRHYAKPLSVNGIARSVGMSKSYFIHKFREQIGSSPIAYLNSFRVLQARELLISTDMPISEIAANCGFRTLSHFNKQFRKHFSQSPRDCRHSCRSS